MSSIHHDVWRRGGIARTRELLRDGHTSHGLTAAVRAGTIVRVRQGHYATPEYSVLEAAAYRVGGRLTGATAARLHGIWSPRRSTLEVEVPAHARGLRSPRDPTKRLEGDPLVRVTWVAQRAPGTRSLVGVAGCLVHIALHDEPRVAFAALESALHQGRLSSAEWARAARRLPLAVRTALAEASRASESGGESLARFGMLAEGIRPRQQVSIPGVGRVDFVVGRRLVIEVDGAAFHDFEEDRRRDAILGALGYRTLRFSYKQVDERWPEVRAAILAAVARGDHL